MFAILGHSLPSFIFALLMLMIFYAKLGWFPPGRISDWANKVIMSPAYTEYTQTDHGRFAAEWTGGHLPGCPAPPGLAGHRAFDDLLGDLSAGDPLFDARNPAPGIRRHGPRQRA